MASMVRRHGITNPVQTLIDVATELEPLRLERSVNEADKLDLVDPETLRRALGTHWQIAYAPDEVTEVLRTLRPHLT